MSFLRGAGKYFHIPSHFNKVGVLHCCLHGFGAMATLDGMNIWSQDNTFWKTRARYLQISLVSTSIIFLSASTSEFVDVFYYSSSESLEPMRGLACVVYAQEGPPTETCCAGWRLQSLPLSRTRCRIHKVFIVSNLECHNDLIQRRQWHPTPVLLPEKSYGQRSLVGCSPRGRWGSDMTEQLHFHFSLSCIGEGNGNPLQCSCLENPRDGRAWWAPVYGVTQSRTRLKWWLRNNDLSTFCLQNILIFWLGHRDQLLILNNSPNRKLFIRLFGVKRILSFEITTRDHFSSDGKESACNVGDPGLIPGSRRSLGEGNGYHLQYSCLENPMDRGAWRATVSPWDRKELDTTEQHFHFSWILGGRGSKWGR